MRKKLRDFYWEWLIDHCLPAMEGWGDPDNWAEVPEFHKLCENYQRETGDPATYGELYWAYQRLRRDRTYNKLCPKSLPYFEKRQVREDQPITWTEERYLLDLYDRQKITRDKLPYSPELDAIVAAMQARFGMGRSRYEILRNLRNPGKAGGAPKKKGRKG